jgi:hypothetical protein
MVQLGALVFMSQIIFVVLIIVVILGILGVLIILVINVVVVFIILVILMGIGIISIGCSNFIKNLRVVIC